MIGLLFASFCAIALLFVGELGHAAEWSASIFLIWGLGIFVFPRPTQHGWRLLAGAAFIRILLLLVDGGLSPDTQQLVSDAGALWNGQNPYLGENPSHFLPLQLWIAAPLHALSPSSLPIQILSIGFDLVLVWLIAHLLEVRQRRPDAAWVYALHPLGALQSGLHGGMDALVMVCTLLAVLAWNQRQSGLGWAGIGGLVGGLPLVLIPALWKRSPWILALVSLLAGVLFFPLGDAGLSLLTGPQASLTGNGVPGLFHLFLVPILGGATTPICAIVGLLMLIQVWLKWRDPVDIALWSATLWIVLAPAIDPASVLWVWIPAMICGVRSWTVLATLTPLFYICLPTSRLTVLDAGEAEWIPWVVYLLFLMIFIAEYLRHQTRPGPWQVGPAKTTSPSLFPT